MDSSQPYIAIQTYSEGIGENTPDDSLVFVRRYPTNMLLLWLSKINAIVFQQPKIYEHTTASLEVLFPGANHSQLLEGVNSGSKAYFSSAVITRVIKACLESFVEGGSDEIVHPHQFGTDLFKTILIFNEKYFYTNRDVRLDSLSGIFKLDIQQQNYIRSSAYYKILSMIKFGFLAKYLADNPDLRKECTEFCRYYEIDDPWQFGKFFLSILSVISSEEQFGKNILEVEGLPSKIISEFTMDPEMFKAGKPLSINMDIIPKPFYFINNAAVILDYNFFQYPIDQGVFYLIYSRTSLRNDDRFKSYNAFQGYIGLDYFEKFLVKKFLSAIFHHRNQKIVSTDEFQDFIVKSSGNRILIIEVKHATVHGKTLEEMDFKAFQSVIDQNFLSEKSTNSKSKGIGQIVKQIKNLVSENSQLGRELGIKSNREVKIYPIIIYSDSNFDISGVNEYINHHFEPKVTELRQGVQSIKPVTLINVSILIDYFAILKNNPSKLTDLISDYFIYVLNNKRKYAKKKHLHHYYLFNRSFATYLKQKVNDDQWKQNFHEMKKDFDLEIQPIH